MRDAYHKHLDWLHRELIHMGALCEDAIASAVQGLLEDKPAMREKAVALEKEIDLKERELETFCIRLILREQPVAGDLRQIIAAQKMIADMDRIGDQAADIAVLSRFFSGNGGGVPLSVPIADMAEAAAKMLANSVDAFIAADLETARAVIAFDDVVDALFLKIKGNLIAIIAQDPLSGERCLDVLMIAKYLERIGDHARNIAKWVEYSITGQRGSPA